MIRLTLSYLRDSMQAYRDILLNAVGLARRTKLNFSGNVAISDNSSTQATDIVIGGGALTTVSLDASATIAVGTLGRFDIGSLATATLADGVNSGDRLGVAWVNGSAANVNVAMGNVETAYWPSISLGDTGVLRVNFVWTVPSEGVAKWHPESSFYIPPA